MKAAIITVGDELVSGEKPDTNFPGLAVRLAAMGVECVLHESVGDDEVAIARALLATRQIARIVVVTGGLGPTSDDVTREGVARALGRGLTSNDTVKAHLSDRFRDKGRTFLDLILKQAYLVENAEVIMPTRGTAPGLVLTDGDQVIYVLPGVPTELDEMFEGHVTGDIAERFGHLAGSVRHVLRTAGLPEAEIQMSVGDLEAAYGAVRIGMLAHMALVDVVVTAAESNIREIETVLTEIRGRLGSTVYGEGDQTLAGVVGGLLREAGMTLATAESCTGGLLAELVTDVAGSSNYFLGGVVAYADGAKERLLGVDSAALAEHGAVSEQVAGQMATGVRSTFGADIGVSITGVAGPEGGTERAPVGTVHICLAGESEERRLQLGQSGTRAQIRARAANMALNAIRLLLLELTAGTR